MTTVNAPAEYGHSGGGIASFTLKSGTNRVHGSVYEYFRNDALDARGFFAPETPTHRQNEFGAIVGGPIHKDKTFFFGWYNGFRLHRAASNSLITVPSDALKRGDFSTYLEHPIQLGVMLRHRTRSRSESMLWAARFSPAPFTTHSPPAR